ncbi:alpha/beta fold hydrolase [Allomuricauda sp. SCSIO 65647]|uniref:alpha/beta fold hydrolase n=1 Tax=Allomuricauda sp. SCSIO 65647 TaxID=2908843 RepID=UPI001F1C36E3|nr:alpha/beta fold hydrolase [Muricauda sp. SCSIO 65647]UJH69188.1 alpha/beta hydrolase [Muricauda sp. SCSIO 65647]
MKNVFSYSFLPLLTVLLFVNCAPLQNVTRQQVKNRTVEQIIMGEGTATIVLETGMGPTMDTWRPILDSLATIAKVYAYNRPGYGSSTVVDPPKNVVEVAQQLHQNLRSNNVPPPYLLIGHSAGGLYINMFARLYPGQVTGVIFLDASHPGQFEYFKNEHGLIYNTLVMSIKKSNRKYELDIVKNAHNDFNGKPGFPEVPISVLTAGKKSSILESKKLRDQWLVFQNELAEMSPKSTHLIVDGSGHYIHHDRPNVIIAEVRKILARH